MAIGMQRLMIGHWGRRLLVRLGFVVALVAFAASTVLSQGAARPDRGVRPTGSYAVSDIENVSMSNGNLNLSIPLASLPPMAGGKMSWTINANYNSKMWDMHSVEEEDTSTVPFTRFITKHLQPRGGGWSIGGSYRIDVVESHDDLDWRFPQCDGFNDPPLYCDPDFQLMNQHSSWFKVTLTTPDGAVHELRPVDGSGDYPNITRDYLLRYSWKTPATTQTTMAYYSYDGSYMWASIQDSGVTPLNWDVYMADGTRIKNRGGNQWISDTNGNSIRIHKTVSGLETTTHYVEKEALREISFVENQAVNPPFGQGRIEYETVGGGDPVITFINYRSTLVHGWAYLVGDDPSCSDRAELAFDGEFTVIDSIVLPQTEPSVTRQFTFAYNSDSSVSANYDWRADCSPPPYNHVDSMSKGLGSLSQITMPSGAVVKYSYLMDLPGSGPMTGPIQDPTEMPADALIKKEVEHDGVTPEVWDYSTSSQFGITSVNGPDGSVVQEDSYPHDRAFQFTHGGSDGKGGLTYRTNQSDRVVIERKWKLNSITGTALGSTGSAQLVPFNPVVDIEFTTLMDPPGVPVKISAKKYEYDLNGSVISETDYDWFDPNHPGLVRDAQGVPTEVPPDTPQFPVKAIRVITNTYYNPATDQSSPNVYLRRVDANPNDENPPTPLILKAPRTIVVGPSQAEFYYDDSSSLNTPPSKGNLTKERHWEGTKWIPTTHAYDSFGNRTSTTDPPNGTDPNGNTTTLVYDPATQAQPISVTVDPDTQVTGDELTTETTYDFSTGLVLTVTDPNDKQTTTVYTNHLLSAVDPFGRPGTVTDPLGRQTKTRYHDNARKLEVWSDLNSPGDSKLRTQTSADMLGRPTKTESSEDGITYSISSETVYHTPQRTTFTSNPHRSGAEPTDGWTRTTTDVIGRVVEVASFSGATLPADTGTSGSTGVVTTTYNANVTLVTDQALKVRRSIVDGLGRMVRVDEPNNTGNLGSVDTPNQATTYTYDTLGNLTQVVQGGQTRTFIYDALSRLKTAANPESGPINYTYYDNGNLLTKTDARGVITTYGYDGLNRVKTRTYSGPAPGGETPGVTYGYDGAGVTNSKGRLTSVSSSVSTYAYTGYDAVGRVLSCAQTTGQTYTMSYQYNLAGGMTRETYPSNKEVVTEYDNAGRIAGVKKDATTYYAGGGAASGLIGYAPHGAIETMKMGNNLVEHTNFNPRLQPEQIGLGTSGGDSSKLRLDYGYGSGTTNNGNVMSQRIVIEGSPGMDVRQDYTYDELNRLKTATEVTTSGSVQQWKQTYDYDRWGNRAVRTPDSTIGITPLTPQAAFAGDMSAFNAANNRIQTSGFSYLDGAGNLTGDPSTGSQAMVYDAENKQIKYTKNGETQYSYDGDGHRVKKFDVNANVTTVFVYNVGGQLIAEYTNSTSPPAGGGGTSYLTTDHLGSTRVVTSADGSVKARYDYLPFGEELDAGDGPRTAPMGYGGSDATRQKFTQKERDAESGLDYFLARYYSSAQGRFTNADEPLVGQDEEDPQTWNLYAYTSNNPLNRTDADGKRWFYQTDDRGKVSDIQWVNPNADGSYTSPGKGWIEFIPTKDKPTLEVFSPDHSKAYYFGENPDGSPTARWLWAGGVKDHTMELVVDYLIFKGIGKAISGVGGAALNAWRAYQAANAAAQGATGLVSKTAAREVVERLPISQAAKEAAKRAIYRATTSSTIDVVKEGSSVVVRVSRPGRTGRQVIESVIDSAGKKTVIQKAYDAGGKLVHYDPKT